jgi:hypothetical protein
MDQPSLNSSHKPCIWRVFQKRSLPRIREPRKISSPYRSPNLITLEIGLYLSRQTNDGTFVAPEKQKLIPLLYLVNDAVGSDEFDLVPKTLACHTCCQYLDRSFSFSHFYDIIDMSNDDEIEYYILDSELNHRSAIFLCQWRYWWITEVFQKYTDIFLLVFIFWSWLCYG